MPKPAAQTLPPSLAVHHNQLGSVCTPAIVCAPAGIFGGCTDWPGVAGVEGGLLGEEPLVDEPLEDELLEEEVDVVLDVEEDGEVVLGSEGVEVLGEVWAGVTGNCDCAVEEDGFPPQPANENNSGSTRAGDQGLRRMKDVRALFFRVERTCMQQTLHVPGG